jgi:hypothetical protein
MASRSSRTRVGAAPQPKAPAPAAAPPHVPVPAPAWLRWVVLAFAAVVIMGYCAGAVADSDTWWHLKTGQYIAQNHKLPVPDPFAWTTYSGKDAYPGEATTRYFNLTHEWLAQLFLYGVYAAGGFPAMVLMRAAWIATFCLLAGWIVWRRTGGFYRAIGASLAVILVARSFAADRPQYVTYVFLALTFAILESRKRLWLLPPLLLVWANCHAGFFLGWLVMGAYCAEALWQRWRGKPPADEKMLWGASLAAILVSGLNPNFYRVLEVMRYYRQSSMQTQIWEWQYPKYWEISPFTVLLYGGVAVLALNWRRSRPVDWFLLVGFGTMGLLAYRNIILSAFVSAFVIASYLPAARAKAGARDWLAVILIAVGGVAAASVSFPWTGIVPLAAIVALFWWNRWPVAAEGGLALVLGSVAALMLTGGSFQLRASDWIVPKDAADFLVKNHIQGKIFNTYAQGGYLLWRLWPEQKVFVDGRALNEGVFSDTQRIGMNAAEQGGKSGEQLLKDYGIDVIVMDGFEPISGTPYYLPAALADPSQKEWKLVYQDIHDVVYMRNPPPGMPVLSSINALSAMEEQCLFLMRHSQPACSQGMYDVFLKIGDQPDAQKWAQRYRDAHITKVYERR